MSSREPVIYELKLNRLVDEVTLSAGEVTRFTEQCDTYVTGLTAGKEEPSPVSVHRVIVRLAWAFYFARKAAPPEEYAPLLLVWLGAMETINQVWQSVAPMELVERVMVPVPVPQSSPPHPESRVDAGLPRPPEIVMQATHPGDV